MSTHSPPDRNERLHRRRDEARSRARRIRRAIDNPHVAEARADAHLRKVLGRLRLASIGLALMVAISLPVARLYFGVQSLKIGLAAHVQTVTDEMSLLASRNPDGWLFERNAVMSRLTAPRTLEVAQAFRVEDDMGALIASEGTWVAGAWPEYSAPVLDSGVRVAQVRGQASWLKVLADVWPLAVLSALLGMSVWWLVGRIAVGSIEALMGRMQFARREAESANRAKSAFLASMSHEIRTPMNGVLSMAEILEHTSLQSAQLQAVRTIRASGQALLRIIDDILDFSKIEAEKLEIEPENVDLATLAESVCDALEPLAEQREVRLSLFVDPSAEARFVGDSTRLRQILNNLIGNAIKFSAGRVGMVGRVAVRVALEGEMVLLEVTDNGIGMDSATVARLFQPFVQADASTTRRFGGTGLGLTICKRLAEMMGGRIEVHSAPREGSVFRVYVKLAKAAEQPQRTLSDLGGISCWVVQHPDLPVEALRAWLVDAHANVQVAPTAGHVVSQLTSGAQTTVIVQWGAALDDVFRGGVSPHVRYLLITGSGRRAAARIGASNLATLDKLRKHSFLHAVEMLAGRASPRPPQQDREAPIDIDAPPPMSTEQARAIGRLILVAEDDAVNRIVIQRQLTLLGHVAEIAEDGQQALGMWMKGHYALLLTDLHMPHLDGYELTERIRAIEASREGAPRTPIVALTANALKGEAERARTVGMDDYLTKPVPLELLGAALERWITPATATTGAAVSAEPSPAQGPAGTAPAEPVFDPAVLRGLIGDDSVAEAELLAQFVDHARKSMDALAAAITAGDAALTSATAHRLKSGARSVGAVALGEVLELMERKAKAGPMHTIADDLAVAQQRAERTCNEIETYIGLQGVRP